MPIIHIVAGKKSSEDHQEQVRALRLSCRQHRGWSDDMLRDLAAVPETRCRERSLSMACQTAMFCDAQQIVRMSCFAAERSRGALILVCKAFTRDGADHAPGSRLCPATAGAHGCVASPSGPPLFFVCEFFACLYFGGGSCFFARVPVCCASWFWTARLKERDKNKNRERDRYLLEARWRVVPTSGCRPAGCQVPRSVDEGGQTIEELGRSGARVVVLPHELFHMWNFLT